MEDLSSCSTVEDRILRQLDQKETGLRRYHCTKVTQIVLWKADYFIKTYKYIIVVKLLQDLCSLGPADAYLWWVRKLGALLASFSANSLFLTDSFETNVPTISLFHDLHLRNG